MRYVTNSMVSVSGPWGLLLLKLLPFELFDKINLQIPLNRGFYFHKTTCLYIAEQRTKPSTVLLDAIKEDLRIQNTQVGNV